MQCNAVVGWLNNGVAPERAPHCLLEEGGNYKHIHNFHLITYNSNTSYIAVVVYKFVTLGAFNAIQSSSVKLQHFKGFVI